MSRVYSLALGEAARDRAIRQVELNSEEWRPIAHEAVVYIARHRLELTSDAVWFVLYNLWKVPPPKEPRALGPVMRKATKLGLIVDTGRTKRSTRPECHTRRIPIYHSLIYETVTGS